jgi:transcriptional regulator with GAF, ATPase, and Fis domain
MNHDPHIDDAPRTARSDAGASFSSEAADDAAGESAASSDNGLAPAAPLHLLESSGTFSCPHCSGTIRLEGVGLKFEGGETSETVQLDLRHPEEALDVVVDDVRRLLAIRALREANGVKVKAAEIAGMKYTTFYELVRRLGITDEDIYAGEA